MASTSVAFKEDAQCKACGSSFGLMKRRHHCRSCGNSYCDSHSPKRSNIAGWPKNTRLCDACVSLVTTPASTASKGSSRSSQAGAGSGSSSTATAAAAAPVVEAPIDSGPPPYCTCGMPLCICDPPEEPAKKPAAAPAPAPAPAAAPSPAPAPAVAKSPATSSFVPFGSAKKTYDCTGDGLREAIKDGDASSVESILAKQPAHASYMDHSGQTMLHLAAMFKQTRIALALVQAGADPKVLNCFNETVYDVSEEALKARLREAFEAVDRTKK